MPNYDLIATTTLSSTGTFSFTSIPQTYKELLLIGAVRGNSGPNNCTVQVNGLSSSIYRSLVQYGQSSTAAMATNAVAGTIYCQLVNNDNYAPFTLRFLNYTNTSTTKVIMGWGGAVTSAQTQTRWEWNSAETNNAITSISVGVNGGSFVSGSQLTIYGLG